MTKDLTTIQTVEQLAKEAAALAEKQLNLI